MNAELPEDVQDLVDRLFHMARTGDMALIEYVNAGVDKDLRNTDGNTLLMLASYAGHADLTKALADLGADVNQVNGKNLSPLSGAIFKKEDAIIDILLDAGADPCAGQPNAVDCAKTFGREDLLPKLGA